MSRIGILAYGSLIEDPGSELEPLIRRRIVGIETPFRIEFARSSATRDGAPTLVPVSDGGAPVSAVILVLDASLLRDQAADLLWRRETRKEQTDEHYKKPTGRVGNRMVVEQVQNLAGIDVVLYTSLPANIPDLSAARLAALAIASARAEAGRLGKEGISYLISVKRQGISTPLMRGVRKGNSGPDEYGVVGRHAVENPPRGGLSLSDSGRVTARQFQTLPGYRKRSTRRLLRGSPGIPAPLPRTAASGTRSDSPEPGRTSTPSS